MSHSEYPVAFNQKFVKAVLWCALCSHSYLAGIVHEHGQPALAASPIQVDDGGDHEPISRSIPEYVGRGFVTASSSSVATVNPGGLYRGFVFSLDSTNESTD